MTVSVIAFSRPGIDDRAVHDLLWTKAAEAAAKSGREPDTCLLYTSPSPRDGLLSRMPSSA